MDHHKRSVNKFTSDDRWYSAIGRFIFAFSQLEYTLKHHVAERIGLRDQYFVPIMNYDFATLCTIAETVLLQKDEEQTYVKENWDKGPASLHRKRIKAEFQAKQVKKTKKLKELIKKCKGLNTERVRIVHGLWTIGGGSGKLHHVSRQTLSQSEHFHEADDI